MAHGTTPRPDRQHALSDQHHLRRLGAVRARVGATASSIPTLDAPDPPAYQLPPVHALEGHCEHPQAQPREGQPLERDRRAVSGERPPERRQRRDDLPTSAGSPGAPWPRPWRTDRSLGRATSGRIRMVMAEVNALPGTGTGVMKFFIAIAPPRPPVIRVKPSHGSIRRMLDLPTMWSLWLHRA